MSTNWHKGTVTFFGSQVPALTRGNIAIFKQGRLSGYRLLHVPTGLGFGVTFRTQTAAKNAANRIESEMPDVVAATTDQEVSLAAESFQNKTGFSARIWVKSLANGQ